MDSFLASLFVSIPFISFAILAISQYILSKKLSIENAWMAFIPILNLVNLIKISGGKWYEIFIVFIPLVNIYWWIRYLWHSISKRTWHGIAWTLGLIFLTIIFLPLTAFWYKKVLDWSTVKTEEGFSSDRSLKGLAIFWGFCLVGLPLLSTTLGMTLGSSQSRSRDTIRTSNIALISTALGWYLSDEGKYPMTPTNECASDIIWLQSYTIRGIPSDPKIYGVGKCDSGYAYKMIQNDKWEYTFVLAARVERSQSANFDGSKWNNITYDQAREQHIKWSVTSKNPKDWYYIVTGY